MRSLLLLAATLIGSLGCQGVPTYVEPAGHSSTYRQQVERFATYGTLPATGDGMEFSDRPFRSP